MGLFGARAATSSLHKILKFFAVKEAVDNNEHKSASVGEHKRNVWKYFPRAYGRASDETRAKIHEFFPSEFIPQNEEEINIKLSQDMVKKKNDLWMKEGGPDEKLKEFEIEMAAKVSVPLH